MVDIYCIYVKGKGKREKVKVYMLGSSFSQGR